MVDRCPFFWLGRAGCIVFIYEKYERAATRYHKRGNIKPGGFRWNVNRIDGSLLYPLFGGLFAGIGVVLFIDGCNRYGKVSERIFPTGVDFQPVWNRGYTSTHGRVKTM